jgi:hypothetical protein
VGHHDPSPWWLHLPVYVGILLAAAVVSGRARVRRRSYPVAAVASVIPIAAVAWSLAVDAEENEFMLPALLAATASAVTFVLVIGPVLLHLWRSQVVIAP